jgi:hypothetical protein
VSPVSRIVAMMHTNHLVLHTNGLDDKLEHKMTQCCI